LFLDTNIYTCILSIGLRNNTQAPQTEPQKESPEFYRFLSSASPFFNLASFLLERISESGRQEVEKEDVMTLKKWIVVVGHCLLMLLMAPTSQAEKARELPEELALVVGQQHVLDAGDIASFSESMRGIVEVKVPRDGRRMILTAVRSGSTSLLLIGRNGTERTLPIVVYDRRPGAIGKELGQLLGDLDGIELRRVGSRIFIDGTVPNKGAQRRVEQVALLYRGQVASIVQIDPNAVHARPNIRLDLTFVELRRRDGYNLGISWPGSIGASGTVSGSLDLLTGDLTAAYTVVDQALPSLEAAAQNGWAKIRKRATVMTTSGHRASYEAGGEVNVAITGSQAAELRTVPYGARLTVTPRLNDEERIIDLEVDAEVADLTETTQDVPGRTVSRVQTLVHLGLGQSIMLSGLDSESETDSTGGWPGLSRIPIFGLLFGTRSHTKDRTEGLIVITPTVIERIDHAGKRLLEAALEKFATFDGDFELEQNSE
jgi:pilus assembly protein CpaC